MSLAILNRKEVRETRQSLLAAPRAWKVAPTRKRTQPYAMGRMQAESLLELYGVDERAFDNYIEGIEEILQLGLCTVLLLRSKNHKRQRMADWQQSSS